MAGAIPPAVQRQAALQSLYLRGPDAGGEWCDPEGRMWLGNRRLAILDHAGGDQPMFHPDDPNLVITYNGEIYNFPSLRCELERTGVRFRTHCDTELLLHGYRAWGIGVLDRIEGMFAFALYDRARRQLLLARDPVGQKPLYLKRGARTLSFASTSAELRCIEPGIGVLSGTALCHILTHGYVPSPMSVFEGVEVLPPGHFAIWTEDGGLRIKQYWAPPAQCDPEPATLEHFREVFPVICAEHTLADVPVGVFLSGGLDSTSVVRALVDGGTPLRCFTLGFGDNSESEAPIAREVARALNLQSHVRDLDVGSTDELRRRVALASAEPQARPGLLTMYAVAERAAGELKVVLSGDGGDEVFGGYPWYPSRAPGLQQTVRTWMRSWRRHSADEKGVATRGSFKAFAARSLLHDHAISVWRCFLPHEANELFAPLSPDYSEDTMLAPLREHFVPTLAPQAALQRVDLMTFCSGSIIPKVDRMSMAHSLEVRSPFLDRRIIDWAMSHRLPTPKRGEQKPILRDFLRGRVPDSVLTHKKQGFGPRGMEDYDYSKLSGEVAGSRLVADGILRRDFMAYAGPDAPFSRRRLWALAAISDWYETVAAA